MPRVMRSVMPVLSRISSNTSKPTITPKVTTSDFIVWMVHSTQPSIPVATTVVSPPAIQEKSTGSESHPVVLLIHVTSAA